ncbi:MAG: serine protease [Deltaproteobacteria bacterium]|jgi:S1-C subfamily serine protease|nr:serine protease [Deltaproteobacteria bacterium]MBW2478486.1 serine protease [Deltaproteobacteria bacterium]
MKLIYLKILIVILATVAATVHAQQAAEKSLDAVVEIRISVPENARTAQRFGTKRVASGVVIDKAGHVLTIGFQTIEAEKVEIVGKDHKTVTATVVAYDRNTGFGLLRATSPLQMNPMPFGSSSEVKQGDPVLAVSYGSANAVQGAVVIARKEFAGPWEYLLENAIFTAPSIERFSGAALINSDGHLVGIGYLFSPLTVAGIGVMPANMFVPIDLLKPILSDLKLSGSSKLPPRPWLGVRTAELYGHLIVERVRSGSPSEKAGIKAGDIIVAVNKQEVQGMADFYRKVWALGQAGVDVPLRILQGVQFRDIVVHSTVADQYRPPGQNEKQTSIEL